MMISKFWWLNFLLCIMLIFVFANTVMIWQEELVAPVSGSLKKPDAWPEPISIHLSDNDREKYETITARNLYNTKRKEHLPVVTIEKPAVKVPTATEKKETDKEKEIPDQPEKLDALKEESLVLYGVIIMKDYKIALVNDPDPENKGRQIRVNEKDKIGKYTIEKIFPTDIIVSLKDHLYRVPLFKENEAPDEDSARDPFRKAGPAAKDQKQKDAVASPRIINTNRSDDQGVVSKATVDKDDGYEWVIKDTPFGKKRIRIRRKK
ncbi:hypothetical protein [uncultured Desulfobacter sp.]|uniref:hypothetical protein n=1 Tax=uncultured Desulfobacter sp. TaxID=240139 RepID=UPI002AABEE21|nr:hypothetical protein [uncultured Desulfobacter sp.]